MRRQTLNTVLGNLLKILLGIIVLLSLKIWNSGVFGHSGYALESMELLENYFVNFFEYINNFSLLFTFSGIIVTSVAFGSYIYNELISTGIYYFVRQFSRTKWYMAKLAELGVYMLIAAVANAAVNTALPLGGFPDGSGAMMLRLTIIYFCSGMFFTLLQNIVSIFIGSKFGFMLSYSIQVILAILTRTFVESNGYASLGLCALSPYYSAVTTVALFPDSSPANTSTIATAFLLPILLIAAGFIIINRYDLGLADHENT